MSNFEYILVLVKRYFLYISYILIVITLHFTASYYSELEYVLTHNYIGYVLLAGISYIHLDDRIKTSKDVLKTFYLVNIVYYLILSWYSLGMALTIFNHVLSLLLIVVILYIVIEKLQGYLIANKPKSNHDKKVEEINTIMSKLPYFYNRMNTTDLTDKQKVRFMQIELAIFFKKEEESNIRNKIK